MRMRGFGSICACAKRCPDGDMEHFGVDEELGKDVASLRAVLSESDPSRDPGEPLATHARVLRAKISSTIGNVPG